MIKNDHQSYVKKNGEAVIPADTLKEWGIKPFTEIEIDIKVPTDGKKFKYPLDIRPGKTVQDFLNEYEEKYGMTSEEFYDKWQQGLIDDTPDLNDWALFYSLKLAVAERGEDPAMAAFKPFKPEESYVEFNQ